MTNHINTSASGSDDEAGAAARIWPLNKFVLTLIAAMASCAMGVIAALQVIKPFVAFLAAPLGPMATQLLGVAGVAITIIFPWGGCAPSSRHSATEPAQRGPFRDRDHERGLADGDGVGDLFGRGRAR